MSPHVTDVDVAIGRRLRQVRRRRELTLEDVAATSGLTVQQVQKMEVGGASVYASALLRVATALGEPVTTFLEPD